MIRYARAPSDALRELLGPAGFLAPLLAPRVVAGLPLDIHLREQGHIKVYCGLTGILDAGLTRGRVRITAHPTYVAQGCGAELFRTWSTDEPDFAAALERYYGGVVVGARWIVGEGAVQAAWSAVCDPWHPIDREAVLGYADAATRTRTRGATAVAAAWAELDPVRLAGRWPPPSVKDAAELDQLGIDADGRLVLIELKDAAATSKSGMFYAPLQLLQYVHEWSAAYEVVRGDLNRLRDARIALGLSTPALPALSGGLRPVIGFGEDVRTAEVRARFDAVLAIANRHLPSGVPPIEVWAISQGRPKRLT